MSLIFLIRYYPYGATQTDTGSISVSHKYTGQELDSETNLYYYGARYYDPVLSKFISADPIEPDYSNPQELNRYSYVLNNPLRYTDPTGYQVEMEFSISPSYNPYYLEGLPRLQDSLNNLTLSDTALSGIVSGPYSGDWQRLSPAELRQIVRETSELDLIIVGSLTGIGGVLRGVATRLGLFGTTLRSETGIFGRVLGNEVGAIGLVKGRRALDDILRSPNLFKRWLKHKHPTDNPLTVDEAKKVWEKIKEIGLNPRLDPGHSTGKYWKGPHINVEGTNIHVPVDPKFLP